VNQQSATFKDRLVKKKEAASLLDCSLRSIDRLVSAGLLTRVKNLGMVRYRLSEISTIANGGAS
jgi:predicted DNA-binding transcriptional regulator AlpA